MGLLLIDRQENDTRKGENRELFLMVRILTSRKVVIIITVFL